MGSECQFFMVSEDEVEFVEHAKSNYSLTVTDGLNAKLLNSDRCIQFERSERSGNLLTAGRIATGYKGEEQIAKTYRSLQRWLKKHYTNDLVAYSEAVPVDRRNPFPYRNFWLGPHARKWLLGNKEAVLRQFRNGAVVFKLQDASSQE